MLERRAALAELGWIDGRTIDFVWRFAVGAAGEETMIEIAGGLARPTGNVTGLTQQLGSCVSPWLRRARLGCCE